MITLAQAIFLGALQGITEFLPISSSGHLVVAQQLFGWRSENGIIMAFDVALHVGTLFAVIVIFWSDIKAMLTGRAWKLMGLLLIATIPAVLVGFSVKDMIEGIFHSAKVVGFAWLFTGTVLWLTKYAKEDAAFAASDNLGRIGTLRSFLIGCAQAVAILPGISRSGSTIAAGLFLKLDRSSAARFAFLMAIPAIAGGAVLDIKDIAAFPREGLPQLIAGTLTSFIVAYFSIKWLLSIIKNGKLWWFGIYCWCAGAITLSYLYFFQK